MSISGYSEDEYQLTGAYKRNGKYFVSVSMYVTSFIDVVARDEKDAKRLAETEAEKKGLYRLMYEITNVEPYINKMELCLNCKHFNKDTKFYCKKGVAIRETLDEGCDIYEEAK